MVMPPCGGFDYFAVVPDGGHSGTWHAQERAGTSSTLTGDPFIDNRLVGPRPQVEFSGRRIKLTASGKERAQLSAISFEVDGRLISALRPKDVLHLTRTLAAGLGISVLRDDLLVVAAGADAAVPLGKNIEAEGAWDLTEEAVAVFRRRDPDFKCNNIPVELTISGRTRLLGSGSRCEIAGYYIEVENSFIQGDPGIDANLSITLLDACPMAAGVLSARYLCRRRGLNMVMW
jgi:hypothetical protein